MYQFKKILKLNRWAVAGVLALMVVQSLGEAYAGYSFCYLFDAYEAEGDRIGALLSAAWVVFGAWVAVIIVEFFSRIAQAKLQQKLKNDLRLLIGRKLAAMDYSELTASDSGAYVSWLTNDVEQIYNQSIVPLLNSVYNMGRAVFGLGAMCILSYRLGLVAVAVFFLSTLLPQFTNKWIQRANKSYSKAMEVSTEAYKDTIAGSPIFILANLKNRITERIAGASQEAERAGFRFNRISVIAQCVAEAGTLVGQIILLFTSMLFVIMGITPLGSILSAVQLSGSFFNGVSAFLKNFLTLRASRPLWEKFNFDEKSGGEGKAELSALSTIELKDVSFSYGDRGVLEGKNYAFHAGGKYAVMGESGCGKTTMAKIILGLLPGYTGRVCYDGVEQRDVSPGSIHDHIAYVDQQVYLFGDTIRFNITLGEPYSDREIMDVVRRCNLEEFISSLPDGLDSVIQENGKNLSGGQRQRIALARGLIRKAEFIILDEGTSALDENNASDIESHLMEHDDIGVIIITHHLRDSIAPQLTDTCRLTA